MPGAVVTQSAPTRTMQGIAVPSESVNPDAFFELTRRHRTPEKSLSYGGGATTQVIELRKADILSSLSLRFVGSLVITGTGAASTAQWPLGIAGVRFTANGQSNLINTGQRGLKHLRYRDYMKNSDLNDRGVAQTFGGTARTQGTAAYAHESWGVGSNTTGIAAGTYPIDLTFPIPVAEDERALLGAIFLQTSTSDLTLSIDEAPLTDLFVAGGATVALTGQWQVEATRFSIPIGPNGQIVIPNLNAFHSIIQTRVANGIANGDNELRVIGQGAGKSLLRIWGQTWNGNGTASAPLPMNATNYGQLGWRFGNNETPDVFQDGGQMRADMERRYNVDLGPLHGVWCHDFANENVFRDTVDMSTTAELRTLINVQQGITLASPVVEYVTETVFLAG